MKPSIIVTGSSGLVGSECARFFGSMGWAVHGIDNNMRMSFFGADGDTRPTLEELQASVPSFEHHDLDIRDCGAIDRLFERTKPAAIIHAAAQPSHDLARDRTVDDFEINAFATLGLLRATQQHVPESPFVFVSTNKVYGDAPNELPLVELETRWEYALPEHHDGIDESCRIDASMHSFFGVSKAAADLMVQEFGRCYGMKTVCFRGGCITGSAHAGAELHGFLAYLTRAAKDGRTYRIIGHKGKQVRDNIHARDLCAAMWSFIQEPRSGAVYNMGGGRENSVSVLEAIHAVQERVGREVPVVHEPEARLGDHICYISDLRRFRDDYPSWRIEHSLSDIFEELCAS